MALDLTHLDHVDGATEPYIADVVCALIAANDCHRVLETGGFLGHTSLCLAETLARLGLESGIVRELLVAEIDAARALDIDGVLNKRFLENDSPVFQWRILAQDVMELIAAQQDESLDAVWIDDDHNAQHVHDEVIALLPKMRPNGLLLFHDVYGSVKLHEVVSQFGGYSLDLPRWGPAGGLGIIQV